LSQATTNSTPTKASIPPKISLRSYTRWYALGGLRAEGQLRVGGGLPAARDAVADATGATVLDGTHRCLQRVATACREGAAGVYSTVAGRTRCGVDPVSTRHPSAERLMGDAVMVRVGDVIDNPVTGETMTFLLTGAETALELLRIDMRVRPGGFVASEHLHPKQEERFQITSGEITLRIAGEECRYAAGDEITIPAGMPHVWWNSGKTDLRVLLEFRPAGRFADFITTFFALARDGRTNRRGIPTNPFQLGATFAEYADVIRGTRPPWAIQRTLFAVLNPIGRALGYRPDVPYPRQRPDERDHVTAA
jgi:quercetin dioxygenase-like cupin family protein